MASVTNAAATVRALEDERDALRAERDGMRDRWLRQVDVNDKLRAMLASQAKWPAETAKTS